MIIRGAIRNAQGSREVTAEGDTYDGAYTALRALVGDGETLLFVNAWAAAQSD